jgi:hypothetical protein
MEGVWVLFWRAKRYARLNRTQTPSPIPAPERLAGEIGDILLFRACFAEKENVPYFAVNSHGACSRTDRPEQPPMQPTGLRPMGGAKSVATGGEPRIESFGGIR